jgi:16S rRNA G966 N2-methylase RsmD
LRAEYFFKIEAWDKAKHEARLSHGNRESRQNSDVTSKDTKKVLSQKLGVSTDTASRIIQIHEKAPEEIKNQLRKGDISINDAYVKIRRQEKEAEHQEQIKVIQSITGQLPDSCNLICGDLKVECMKLEPQSIDYIITDPPYGKEYLQLYADLSEVSKYVLKPMGSLFVMTGQSYLPEIINLLTKNMTYHWTICYLTPGDSTMLWQRNVRTNWKPIVWLTPNGNKPEWHTDIVESPKKDKQFMNWGQSEEGMADIIGKYTKKGEVILDPFLGAGTTGIVALRMERRFIGIELSPDTFKTAQGRILNDKTGIN